MEETVDARGDVAAIATPESGSDPADPDPDPADPADPADPPDRAADPADPAADSARLGYEEFVALRAAALVRLARGLLRDPYLAEDVVQDVLARALLQWPRVSAAHDVDAYVRRMVVNACTSWFRRAARRERVTDQGFALDRPVPDGADQFVDRDLLIALLRRLPAKQRAVLVLRHYEGLPDAEIAQALGSSEVTVRSNAHRGLARLRELIAEAEPAQALPTGPTGPTGSTGEIKLRSGRRPRRPSR